MADLDPTIVYRLSQIAYSIMSKPTVELQDVELDFSEAVVEKATASIIDLEVKVRGVPVPERRLSSVLLRFEGIANLDEIWYKLNTKIRRTGSTEIHDAWPLKLPADLKTLVQLKSRGKSKKFQFAVAEEHFNGRKKPLEFSCKRFCITDSKGKHLAGDESKISGFRKWSENEVLKIADQFAIALENRDFRQVHGLFGSRLAKSHPLAKVTEQFERLMKRPRHLEQFKKELATQKSYEHSPVGGYDPDTVPKSVAPDDVQAVVQTGFIGWFCVNLVFAEQKGELRILNYSVDRDWEMALF